MATRWGIVSAGLISNDFVTVLNTLPKEEHQIVCVAARDLQKAKDFASHHKIPKAYGSYEELAKDKDVEIAYIGVILPEHLRLGKMMLEAGKHVLMEKSMAVNSKQVKELIQLAKKKKLFLMEAIWSRFFPVYRHLKEELSKKTIGDIVHICVCFGLEGHNNMRLMKKSLGGGALLDIGVYTVNAILYALNGKTPQKIAAVGRLNDDGADVKVCASFVFSTGETANMAISTVGELPCVLEIIGTKGVIKVHRPFWCPTKMDTPHKTYEYPLPETPLPCNFVNSSGLRYQAMEVRECLKKGLTECPLMTHKDSENIAEILEEIRHQVGVVYPADEA